MTTNPSVCCVMLLNGRHEMAQRALKSFHSQTYSHKKLLILGYVNPAPEIEPDSDIVNFWSLGQFPPQNSIGALRNLANGLSEEDIICHWDSDDWSHPNRITEQVSLLTSSGAECVGYNEMLFWREQDCEPTSGNESAAWLYRSTMSNYALGTSMCYWSDVWRRHTFPDRSEGCDDLYWSTGNLVKIAGESSYYGFEEPRMIASIHGGNTCARLDPGKKEWTRVPEWDAYCRERMKL